MMQNVPHFERNQGRGRKYHQQFRPSLFHINANSFGKKNRRIKQRQKTGGTQCSTCEHDLQFVEQKGHWLAVLQQDLVRGPIRKQIHPAGTRVQEKQRNAKQKQQHAFADFEERDELKIAMATRLLQNRRNVRRITHHSTLRRNSLISQ